MLGLDKDELKALESLSTPGKVQDFLDALPRNFEKRGDTLYSPRRVLRERKAHCIEGALLAGVAFWIAKRSPIILDLKATQDDDSHVVTLFQENGYWGAVSKTNHATLRWRDPIYRSVREVALSYFHEYFLNESGKKTLRSYMTYNLKRLGTKWITAEDDLLWLNDKFDKMAHIDIVPVANRHLIRAAAPLEREAGELLEFRRSDRGT